MLLGLIDETAKTKDDAITESLYYSDVRSRNYKYSSNRWCF